MRSFQNHFSNLVKKDIVKEFKKPVLRSSAIFPFILNQNLDTRITFLSYWFLKRNISEVSISATLRDEKGSELFFFSKIINETNSHEYSVREILKKKKIKNLLCGSIEIEVNSTQDMVFPFPAITVSYKGNNSNAYVHSCGRIFNNLDDKKNNTDIQVGESGFDVLPYSYVKPFFSFVNGPNTLKNQKLKLKLINYKGQQKEKIITLDTIKPYSTKIIFFLKNNEKKFFKKEKGTVKIYHHFKDFFPRFMCGALDVNNKFSTLTHSYYDLSDSKNKKIDLWKNPDKKIFFDSSTSVPVYFKNKKFTEFAIYPNFIKKKFSLKFDLFSSEGKNLKLSFTHILDKKLSKPIYLNLTDIFSKKSLKRINENCYARVSTFGGGITPTRLKFGLNIGQYNKMYNLSSNICFNANVPVIDILNKNKAFKWSCIFYEKNFELLISNFSYLKDGFKEANAKLTFWNQSRESFSKKIKISDNGFFKINPFEDKKLKKFLMKKVGWITIETDNPFVNGYYVNFGNHGIIGADHIY
ncbi:hypothetical protein [Candidatus Pelagibacter sp. HIMB1587]|uniref:hypothetical protein n=1 Tax=Candidatus Pelagibacter sp. HIMB1587 TaxID=3413354 RepID=UPI003F8596CC